MLLALQLPVLGSGSTHLDVVLGLKHPNDHSMYIVSTNSLAKPSPPLPKRICSLSKSVLTFSSPNSVVFPLCACIQKSASSAKTQEIGETDIIKPEKQ